METLKPCPFCGDEMITYKDEQGIAGFEHPLNADCLLSQYEFPNTTIETWNRRI